MERGRLLYWPIFQDCWWELNKIEDAKLNDNSIPFQLWFFTDESQVSQSENPFSECGIWFSECKNHVSRVRSQFSKCENEFSNSEAQFSISEICF